MTGTQTFVGAGGMGLIALNYWTGQNRQTVSAGIFGSGSATAAHSQLVVLGGELLFVIVAAVLAGMSDSWGLLMAAVVAALFVLFAINHYGSGQTSATPATSTGAQGSVRGVAA